MPKDLLCSVEILLKLSSSLSDASSGHILIILTSQTGGIAQTSS